MTDAVVHIGPLPKRELIARYYRRCGLETIGMGRITVGAQITFDTFDQLLDNMSNRGERFQIVVNHANPNRGLIVPFATGSQFNATGDVISQLSAAADRGTASVAPNVVADLASQMGVSRDAALRMVQKLSAVRARTPFIEFRGCNIGADLGMLERYKRAFGAVSVCGPNCRMFYLPIAPHRPGRGETMRSIAAGRPNTGKTRRRLFEGVSDFTLEAAGPLVIDVRDIDGHTQVDNEAFMDKPGEAVVWAIALNGAWQQASSAVGSNEFVLPVLWDNQETTFHAPLDFGFRSHLARV